MLTDYGLVGWPKTSGSRGFHIFCRSRAAAGRSPRCARPGIALAREVEPRVPDIATSRWWKEERHGVFIDYNQNAKDRTTVSAYSVRPDADARVSTPLRWDEVADCDPADFTVATVPQRFARLGDLAGGIDDIAGDLTGLLELADAAGRRRSPTTSHRARPARRRQRAADATRRSR